MDWINFFGITRRDVISQIDTRPDNADYSAVMFFLLELLIALVLIFILIVGVISYAKSGSFIDGIIMFISNVLKHTYDLIS